MTKAAKAELWRRGILAPWKLAPCQYKVYKQMRACPQRIFVFEKGRRFGGSFIIAVIKLEDAIRKDGSVQHYAAPTGKMVRNIFVPNLRAIAEDAPDDVAPVVKVSDGTIEFPHNGSIIHMAGCEDMAKADRLRGPASDRFDIDEGGFIDCLKYVVTSVAAPQLMTTKGHMAVVSSPPVSPGHHFTSLAIDAESKGAYAHRNIYDSTRNNRPDIIAEFIELCGGEDTPEWQREYLAKRVIDAHRAIIPEFAEAKSDIVGPLSPPEYYDTYVAMDVGWSPSLTVVLFGYWDMTTATLCIQREVVMSKMTTDALAGELKTAEAELWTGYFAKVRAERPYKDDLAEVYTRVSDIDKLLIHDMANLHGMDFSPAVKDDKDTAINTVRIAIRKRKIRIDPSCVTLIGHLEAGVWNKKRTGYDWVPGFGHFDAIDALIYMRRHVDESHNPWPHHTVAAGPDYYTRPGQEDPDLKTLREAFR